jgi:hypothetical protein
VVGALAWLLPQLGLALIAPLTLFSGALGKILTVIVLARGFAAVRQSQELRKQIIATQIA